MTKQEVKQLRVKLGLSQQEFATKLGIGIMTVSRWERGITKPSRMAQRLLKEVESNLDASGEEEK